MMNSCVFAAKLSDFADTSLLAEYSSLLKGENVGSTSCSSAEYTQSAVFESLTICGYVVGKSSGLLSWVVRTAWARIVKSRAIFEIWRLVFALFSALLEDIIKLAKTAKSGDTGNPAEVSDAKKELE